MILIKPTLSSLLFFVLFSNLLVAQPETVKWKKKEIDFTRELPAGKTYRIDHSDFFTTLASSAQTTYYFLISDYDGDNCPFHPSCSAFFVRSVGKYNILKGSLMFADRFTRDLNFLKGFDKYPRHASGKFFDPVNNYSLNYNDILIIPHDEIVDDN